MNYEFYIYPEIILNNLPPEIFSAQDNNNYGATLFSFAIYYKF